jgi:hypothetical protein
MPAPNIHIFTATIHKIGINPYVFVPATILARLFREAKRDKGPIPVKMVISDVEFVQHLVKYRGEWRLYLNTPMRKAAGKETGEKMTMGIFYDSAAREEPVNKHLDEALAKNKKAKQVFLSLAPSRQKEIVRYINQLKTSEAVETNVVKAINFLLGKQRFVGRDKP